MIKRIICDIVLFAIIFLGPWWLVTVLGLIFVIVFKNYWEMLVVGVFMDALYYIPSNRMWGNFGIFSLLSLLIIIATEKAKKQIRI